MLTWEGGRENLKDWKSNLRSKEKIELGGGESDLQDQVLVRTKKTKSEWSELKKAAKGIHWRGE